LLFVHDARFDHGSYRTAEFSELHEQQVQADCRPD